MSYLNCPKYCNTLMFTSMFLFYFIKGKHIFSTLMYACTGCVQEELLHYPGHCIGVGGGFSSGLAFSKMLKFYKASYPVRGQVLSHFLFASLIQNYTILLSTILLYCGLLLKKRICSKRSKFYFLRVGP